jgi:hypothetical protein
MSHRGPENLVVPEAHDVVGDGSWVTEYVGSVQTGSFWWFVAAFRRRDFSPDRGDMWNPSRVSFSGR